MRLKLDIQLFIQPHHHHHPSRHLSKVPLNQLFTLHGNNILERVEIFCYSSKLFPSASSLLSCLKFQKQKFKLNKIKCDDNFFPFLTLLMLVMLVVCICLLNKYIKRIQKRIEDNLLQKQIVADFMVDLCLTKLKNTETNIISL